MNDLQRLTRNLFDNAIGRTTIEAQSGLFTVKLNLFTDLVPPELVEVWPTKLLKEASLCVIRQQDVRAILQDISFSSILCSCLYLADLLQDREDRFEIPNVEQWKSQLDVAEVSIAPIKLLFTSWAVSTFDCDSETPI